MSLFTIFIFLVGVSVASCVNFSTVYEWGDLDFLWPSEASREKAVKDGTFAPEKIEPRYLAVYRDRLFLSLEKKDGVPATLVSLPTASSQPPKLAPFPSWPLHESSDCNGVVSPRGIEVDAAGWLWVVDQGSKGCVGKLWIFSLDNNDEPELEHPFPATVVSAEFWERDLNDIVLDQRPDDTFAYIADSKVEHLVVFSLKSKFSRSMPTRGKRFYFLALSPREERLYLSKLASNDLYVLPTADLRVVTPNAEPTLQESWAGKPYRMLFSNDNVLYAAFIWRNYVSAWNISEPFSQQQRVYETDDLGYARAFAFALDATGNLWLMERNSKAQPRHKLLKAAVGAASYLHSTDTSTDHLIPSFAGPTTEEPAPVETTASTVIGSTTSSTTASPPVPKSNYGSNGCGRVAADTRQGRVLIDILICLAQSCQAEAGNAHNNSGSQEARKISIVVS